MKHPAAATTISRVFLAALALTGCSALSVEPGDSRGDIATVRGESARKENSNRQAAGPCNGIQLECTFTHEDHEIRVSFAITSGLSERMTSVLARVETSRIVENAYELDPQSTVWVTGTFPVNLDGSIAERPVVKAVYSPETVKQVATHTIEAPDVWEKADDHWVHRDL
jgi:hypothetical protein